jgi:hypothetical protein
MNAVEVLGDYGEFFAVDIGGVSGGNEGSGEVGETGGGISDALGGGHRLIGLRNTE